MSPISTGWALGPPELFFRPTSGDNWQLKVDDILVVEIPEISLGFFKNVKDIKGHFGNLWAVVRILT